MSAPEKHKPVSVSELEETVNGTSMPTDPAVPTEHDQAAEGDRPAVFFGVSAGHPSDTDIAALAAVLIAIGGAAHSTPPDPGPAEVWGRPVSMHRSSHMPFSPNSYSAPRN